ncbi:chemotaxis protein CheB [Flavitalea flava]
MKKLNKTRVKALSTNLFPVVGVGASAGGLEAFKKLVSAIPLDSGMAYILVQHLDPTHESILSELLQKVTKIPVQEITDNIKVEANHIYIIPSNKLLTATDGILQLSARHPKGQKNLPIDLFFSSLAEVHQNHAIGVVLSGTASDGTIGLKAIKDHGGVTIAQSQESAAYDGMPKSAIEAGVVDFILPPDQIPQQLLRLKDAYQAVPAHLNRNGRPNQDEQFRQIIAMLRVRKNVDFTYYKQPTIRRWIERRMALSMKPGLAEYILYLRENKGEQDILFQDLLIPVTQFFRDPKVFVGLKDTVLPDLVNIATDNEPIRIWIAGCSTGEEAYSMVMCFQAYIMDKASSAKIQVFATDISEIAITKARMGIYSKNEVNGLTVVQLQQFFTKIDGKFRINKNIRDACIFAHHNYLKDPPFAKIDLISCRNSLIYLEPFLQKKALTTFHYALKENRYLLLGKSETAAQALEVYNTLDKTNKIYARKSVKGNFLHALSDRKESIFKEIQDKPGKKVSDKDDFEKSGDELLLTKFVPAGVIVNDAMEIVQFRGATGAWLEAPPGKPSRNVLKMVREGLAFELRSALHVVKKSKESFIKENISMLSGDKEKLVTIEVHPLANTHEPYFLLLFRDTQTIVNPNPAQAKIDGQLVIPISKQRKELNRIQQLEKELAQARADMRNITEDQEAANEELQSANEELLSGSEELQSVNEELETSKEEVQTSNEELIVVNHELYERNEQLNVARVLAESIVSTIREPLIILSKELTVKTVNKSFYEKFQIPEEEIVGKPLFELGDKLWDMPALRKMLDKVLPQKINIVDFEVVHIFPLLGERTMILNASPIITEHNDEPSILIAIEDVTEKKKAENELKQFAQNLEKLVFDKTFALQQANNDLKVSNENLEQFSYIASHDLQEPLRKIKTFSGILQDKFNQDLPDAGQLLVKKISNSSERMSTLINELHKFSKLLHGQAVFKQTNLDESLNLVIGDFELLIKEKNVTITRKPLPIIDAIPFQINQLFYNLISNAIKFSKPDRAPVITITSRIVGMEELAKHANIDPKLSYCEIAIEDNGIGFKQQYADQIFLVFHRLHGQSEYFGTGIGLALCKKIVANHHGEITATSKDNEGATFKLLLPLSL